MYWRRGIGRTVLWVAALTCALCAVAAAWKAGSPTAAKALALLALVLNPVAHEVIARVRHVRAPAKLAYFAVLLLVPLAFGALAIEGMAAFEAEARRQGYASAADRQRARDLKLPDAAALAAYDAQRLDRFCRAQGEHRPLECFPAGMRAAALAFAQARFDEAELEPVIKAALADQRARLLAIDTSCAALLDRVDEDAVEAMTADPGKAVAIKASIWAARLPESDLKLMAERSKPGVSHVVTTESRAADERIAAASAEAQRLFTERLQSWARDIVLHGTGWKQLLRGPLPAGSCKMAHVTKAL